MRLTHGKALLRTQAIARRDGIGADARRAGAEAIACHGIGFSGAAAGAIVSGFAAIGAEIDPMALMQALAAAGHPLALPVITTRGSSLIMRRWAPDQPLRSGQWGIREPLAAAPEVEPDVVLVPLLAFDRAGRRLGYGAGYFDRTIARLRAAKPLIAIGLAYVEQEVAEVPTNEHDEVLDWVLTPEGVRGGGKLGAGAA